MNLSPEAQLRGELAEILRAYEVEMPLLNGIPDEKTKAHILEVGELAHRLMSTDKVSATVRADMLGQLLDAGVSPNARFGGRFINGQDAKPDGTGRRSLLMMAVSQRFAEGMQLLLDRGADILLAKEDYGCNVVDHACGNGDAACLKIALRYATLEDFYGSKHSAKDGSQAPHQLFEMASAQNVGWKWDGDNVQAIRLLLEAGLSREGLLAKAVQAANDCPSIIDVLVEGGCDVNEHDFAPACKAAYKGRAKMLHRLLELGADPLAKSKGGATLMQCGRMHPEVKEVLRAWKTSHTVATAVGAGSSCNTGKVKKSLGMAL